MFALRRVVGSLNAGDGPAAAVAALLGIVAGNVVRHGLAGQPWGLRLAASTAAAGVAAVVIIATADVVKRGLRLSHR